MTTRIRRRRMAVLGGVALLIGFGGISSAPASRAGATTSRPAAAGAAAATPACPPAPRGQARCFALISPTGRATRLAVGSLPKGYGPSQLRSAYALPASGGTGQTVALVEAYGDPHAESDLAIYRSTYGLSPCTTADGCFRKLNQVGKAGPYPSGDAGWAVETSLDLDMVSAACPKCHIVLVEANSQELTALGKAEDTAVAAGAVAVSNSYGAPEYLGLQDAKYYDHPGVAILASSGDAGYGAPNTPAVLPTVIGVGGTSLRRARNARGWAETAWFEASSGCSAYVPRPAWQTRTTCPMRSTSDISAVADPSTGVAVYDTYELGSQAGWLVVGGTSVASPLVAGIVGLAGNAGVVGPAYVYAHPKGFYDVVGGSNGACDGNYLCTAVKGYDGPTGLGTPRGTAGL